MKSKKILEMEIYELLKTAIMNRELVPGTKLPEETLASILDVSRTPIRSALKKLSYEMYVDIFPHKGAFVAQPTIKEAQDVFEMRKYLEELSVRKACESTKVSEDAIKRIEKLIELESKAYEQNNLKGVFEHIQSIHIEIARLSGNDMLISQLDELISLTTIYQTFYSNNIDQPDSPDEHLAILSAIKKGDKDKAVDLMNNHIKSIVNKLNFSMMKYPNRDLKDVLINYKKPLHKRMTSDM